MMLRNKVLTEKLKCTRCNKEVFLDQVIGTGKECNVRKCFFKKPSALKAAADKGECDITDLFPVVDGKIEVVEEKDYTYYNVPDNDFNMYGGGYC